MLSQKSVLRDSSRFFALLRSASLTRAFSWTTTNERSIEMQPVRQRLRKKSPVLPEVALKYITFLIDEELSKLRKIGTK
jgi:hypothetical protein